MKAIPLSWPFKGGTHKPQEIPNLQVKFLFTNSFRNEMKFSKENHYHLYEMSIVLYIYHCDLKSGAFFQYL